MSVFRVLGLFVLTALAEIVGCYAYLWLRREGSVWLLRNGTATEAS